jgi:hypothetical protein
MTSNSDHIAALIARFPRIFKAGGPRFGITAGAGWNALLTELFDRIDRLLDDRHVAQFRIVQIKEKFGGLRVYYQVGDDAHAVLDVVSADGVSSTRVLSPSEEGFPRAAIDRCIAEAAALAIETCERCGNPGELREGGWMRVLCERCNLALADGNRTPPPSAGPAYAAGGSPLKGRNHE